jgi:hypothetical protein
MLMLMLAVLIAMQWFDAETGDSGLTTNTGMSYLFTLVNTTKCGATQRQARSEFIDGCKDEEGFLDQFGQPCSLWELPGYDCKTAQSVHYYSLNGQRDILNSCLESCGSCAEMDACRLDVQEHMVLEASDSDEGDTYGSAVAISGDATVVIVGAPTADMPEPDCNPLVSDCGEGASLADPTDHGIAYAHVNACPRLILNHSTATAKDPCFAPVRGGECFFECGQGYFVASNASAASELAALVRPRAFRLAPHQAGAIACHGMGQMTARWDFAECLEVECPLHSTGFFLLDDDGGGGYAGDGKECRCDQGYSGDLWWNASTAEWNGECYALPCEQVFIPHSDRAAGALGAGGLGPCNAVTGQSCSYHCDVSYRAHSGATESGLAFRAHAGYTEAPGAQGHSAPMALGQAQCTPAGVFIYTGCFSVPCPMHGRLVMPERRSCICDEGFAGDVTWLAIPLAEGGEEGAEAAWSEPCEGEWLVSRRARAWLFNIFALGVVTAGGLKARQYYKQKLAARQKDKLDALPDVSLTADDDSSDPEPGQKQGQQKKKVGFKKDRTSSGGGAPTLTGSSPPASPVQQVGLNESLPGQLGSPERRPHPEPLELGGAAAGLAVAAGGLGGGAGGGKLVLPPLLLSRKTGAAYYVNEDGLSVWASSLPPPATSLLAADGSPYRDVYHGGPMLATHMDNLQRGDATTTQQQQQQHPEAP